MNKEVQAKVETKKPATEEDCKAGRAIFYIPDHRSEVYDLGRPLPLTARYKQDTPTSTADQQEMILAGTSVEIIQCEIVDNAKILIGYRCGKNEGVCTLNEIEIEQ